MSPTAPLVIDEGEAPSVYSHPYLITLSFTEPDVFLADNIERKDINVWEVTDTSTPPRHIATLHGEFPHYPRVHFFAEKLILTTCLNEFDHMLFIHKIGDGSLCDVEVLVRDSDPEGSLLHPIPGDRGLIGVTDNLVAALKIGTNGNPLDTTVEVFGVSEEGKFVLKNELRLFTDEAVVKDWRPSTYHMPNLIQLTENTFVGALSFGRNHDVHILRWTTSISQSLPSHTKLPAIIQDSDVDEEWLWASRYRGHVYIPFFNSFIFAHIEDLIADQSTPHTTLRRINAKTLDLDWCVALELEVMGLWYDQKLNVIVMFGYDFYQRITTVVDVQTGAVRRRAGIEAGCDVTRVSLTSKGELFTVYVSEVLVMKLSDFIEHGYPKDQFSGSANQPLDDHIVVRFPLFDPAVAVTDQNAEKCRTEQVECKRGYRASFGNTGSRYWVPLKLLGDHLLILMDRQTRRYAIYIWK